VAEVAVEFSVDGVAGVSGVGAPDLLAGFGVAAEDGDAVGGAARLEDGVGGGGVAVIKAMGFEDGPLDAGVAKHGVELGGVGALGKPEAGGIAVETVAVGLDADLDMGVRHFGRVKVEREDGVGGGGGSDFEDAKFLEVTEGVEEVAAVVIGEEVFDLLEAIAVKTGETAAPGLAEGAVAADVVFGEEDGALEVIDEATLEEGVAEHGAESRGEGAGDLEIGDAVVFEPGEDVEERDVGFGEGFEEPVFFEETRVLGVTDVGEMGVEDEGEVAGGRRKGDRGWWVSRHGLGCS
jgi:hypothetical protein